MPLVCASPTSPHSLSMKLFHKLFVRGLSAPLLALVGAFALLAPLARPLASSASTTPSPYKILIIGDSISADLGYALSSQLQYSPSVEIINRGRPSSGLSNSWFYDWPRELNSFLRTDHPNLVICLLGANDVRSMDVSGHAHAFFDPSWRSTYQSFVSQLLQETRTAGARMLWLGAPVVYSPPYSAGLARLNSLYQASVLAIPSDSFLPTWNLLTASPGRFEFTAPVNGRLTAVRTPDGIHPTDTGSGVLATDVIRFVAAHYHLPIHPKTPMVITRL